MTEAKVAPSLVGKSGELLVAAELMRKGVEVAIPASDVGVDLLAYRLRAGEKTAGKFVPVQVKTYSGTGYRFLKSWFEGAPGLALVSVWHVVDTPQFYIFASRDEVEEALGNHVHAPSWTGPRGIWTETEANSAAVTRMQAHRDRWERIIDQLGPTTDT